MESIESGVMHRISVRSAVFQTLTFNLSHKSYRSRQSYGTNETEDRRNICCRDIDRAVRKIQAARRRFCNLTKTPILMEPVEFVRQPVRQASWRSLRTGKRRRDCERPGLSALAGGSFGALAAAGGGAAA